MWFEQLKEWITWFFNLPLPIAGITTATAGIFLLILFSKTSLGKKILNKIMNAFKKLEESFNALKIWIETKINELKKYYEEKLQIVEAKNKRLEKLLIAVSENIHNEQVKKLVADYCEQSEKVLTIADAVDDAVIETKNELEKEFNSAIADYKSKLELEFNEYKAKYEKEYEEKTKELEEQIAKYKELAEIKVEKTKEQIDNTIEEIEHEIDDKSKEITDQIEETIEKVEETVEEKSETLNGVVEHVQEENSEISKE